MPATLPDLPISPVLPALRAALATHTGVVLEAPPGAGKTTLVPLALLDASWLHGRRIVMLEPRRLAARAAATRMAALCNEAVGATVGYRIRFERKVSAATRIEVVTEGMLTRRLQVDPELADVGLVIFDEFHERHLTTDLALALTLDAGRALRPDLRVLVMSATLDGAAVAQLLTHARGSETPVLRSEGRSFPVDIRYTPPAANDPLGTAAAARALAAMAEHAGDALVFLPGAREIRRAQAWLTQRANADIALHVLHGDAPQAAQDAALQPGAKRKIILATPIAETSLTIEGVQIVIDAGFARAPAFDPNSGMTRLDTVRISKASAAQRAGRAGRTSAGVCYRLWNETVQHGLVAHTRAEILQADLAPLVLELAAWGIADAAQAAALPWLDAPPAPAYAQAQVLLRNLHALKPDGRISDVGTRMSELPVHPRLARMLLAAPREHLSLACDLAALLAERDIFRGGARNVDMAARVDALRSFRTHATRGAYDGADADICRQVERASAQWRRLVDIGKEGEKQAAIGAHTIGRLLSLAYPDRIGKRREGGGGRYLLANGRGAALPAEAAHGREEYLVVPELDAGSAGDATILRAAACTEADIRTQFPADIEKVDVVAWDARAAAVIARRQERFGALALNTAELADSDPAQIAAAMANGVRALGLAALPWSDAAQTLRARIEFLRRTLPDEAWPDLSDSALTATLDTWLTPYLAGMTRAAHLARLDLAAILAAQLDHRQRARLDSGAPTHVSLPSGVRVRLRYGEGDIPILAVKLQALFGCVDTPRVAFETVPVLVHLLSPAQRPIQVTQDLRGFWARTYAEVKKELKGRYPRQAWPDDPLHAPPTPTSQRK